MKIALFHGYELRGSGSNEYTRYLARALAAAGNDVHVLCREPRPEEVLEAQRALDWDARGQARRLFERAPRCTGSFSLHRLPDAGLLPVYLEDKQRGDSVKSFPNLTDEELAAFHRVNVGALAGFLDEVGADLLHANHVVYQPVVAAEACRRTGTPFVCYPHGSSIEYTVREDARYERLARLALERADGLIIGNREVEGRLHALWPDAAPALRAKTDIVGVGVDTELFRPVARAERAASLAPLLEHATTGGRGPRVARAARELWRAGELDAALELAESYDRGLPDEDLSTRLAAVDRDAPIILFVGALTCGKGLQSVLAALPRLLERVPDAQLLIVGSGRYREVLEAFRYALACGDEALATELVERGWDLEPGARRGPWLDVAHEWDDAAARARMLGAGNSLTERVHFLGRLDHGLLARLFPCADLAVFPSLVPEAYPLVLMESLANGVLPVVSDFSGFSDGIAELERDLGAEWGARMRLPVEPRGRVAAIAERLAEAVRAPGLDELRPRLRRIAEERYDWSVRAREMITAYERVLSRAARGRVLKSA